MTLAEVRERLSEHESTICNETFLHLRDCYRGNRKALHVAYRDGRSATNLRSMRNQLRSEAHAAADTYGIERNVALDYVGN